MSQVKQHAEAVAASSQGYGIATELILVVAEYAIPALIKCWLANRTGVTAGMSDADKATELKHLAEANYLGSAGYDWRLIRDMQRSTRDATIKAIEQIEGRTMTHHELHHDDRLSSVNLARASSAILDRARTSELSGISGLLTEVATIDLNKI
jgi:hypothetical protein